MSYEDEKELCRCGHERDRHYGKGEIKNPRTNKVIDYLVFKCGACNECEDFIPDRI